MVAPGFIMSPMPLKFKKRVGDMQIMFGHLGEV